MFAKSLAALAAACVFVSSPAFARAVNKKHIQNTSYGSSSNYSTTSERRASSPSSAPELKFVMGTVFGSNAAVEDGDATLLGIDAIFKKSREVFIPVGVTRWQGDLNDSFFSATYTVTHFDAGIGYRNWVSYKTYVPVGVRAGLYSLEVEGHGILSGLKLKEQGWALQPFTGFTTNVSKKLSLGYEARVVLAKATSSDFEESDEESKRSNSLTSYHAFNLTLLL